jgi:serine phosphatase RsbU (regulator of sigma subunit)
MTIANAGHLAPWRNGEELDCGNNLPLGIVENLHYEECEILLAPNDTLTFLSDGVVEARNARGELYGFDRTAAISTRTAAEIARAASTHGQEDDITVLTLAFTGAEVLYA